MICLQMGSLNNIINALSNIMIWLRPAFPKTTLFLRHMLLHGDISHLMGNICRPPFFFYAAADNILPAAAIVFKQALNYLVVNSADESVWLPFSSIASTSYL
jgi:hypothetical protein